MHVYKTTLSHLMQSYLVLHYIFETKNNPVHRGRRTGSWKANKKNGIPSLVSSLSTYCIALSTTSILCGSSPSLQGPANASQILVCNSCRHACLHASLHLAGYFPGSQLRIEHNAHQSPKAMSPGPSFAGNSPGLPHTFAIRALPHLQQKCFQGFL